LQGAEVSRIKAQEGQQDEEILKSGKLLPGSSKSKGRIISMFRRFARKALEEGHTISVWNAIH